MNDLRVGISLTSSMTGEAPSAVAQAMAERAAAAHEAGMTSLSVGDHHAQRGWYMQNTPVLGRLLAEWPDRPAGCLFLLPLWHPLVVAEHVGTLASMVDAPFIVQVGIGTGKTQFDALNASLSTRGRDTDESIRVVQALLAGETAESELLGMGPVSIGLRPTQPVEWWIGGHAKATLRRAATVGTAWYGGPNLSSEESASLIAAYHHECGQAGSVPRAIVRRDVLVLADGDRARAEAAAIIERGYRGMTLEDLVVGDPADAERQLQELSGLGYDDVIVRCVSPVQADALETIHLLGALNEA